MTDDFRSPYEIEAEDARKDKPDTPKTNSKVSQVDSLVDNAIGAVTMGSGKKSKPKKEGNFWSRGLVLWPSSRNQKIIGSSAAAALLILGWGGIYALSNSFKYEPAPEQQALQHIPSKTEPSKLTGVEVPKKINKQRIIGVMIENSPDARPQAGLDQAGVVFEAIAEGGITRFHALFLESNPNYLGPVRSVRPYYAEWSAGFDAAFAHAGGSEAGLARLNRLKMSDLDYTIAVNAYQRVSDRFAPHNLYTSLDALRKEAKRLKYNRESKFEGFERKEEPKNPGEASVQDISFNISSDLYNVRYAYDKKSNSYKRFMAGQPHRDQKSNKQISPKVVVALIAQYSQNGIYSVYKTTGKGEVIVFQDGKAIRGTWKKNGPKKPLEFFDSKGNPLQLNSGQTWITALKNRGEARY